MARVPPARRPVPGRLRRTTTPRLWKQHFAENPLRFDLDRIAVKTTRISVSYRLRLPIRESFPVCAMVGSSGDDQRRNNQDRRDGESDPHASCNGIGGRRSNVARR